MTDWLNVGKIVNTHGVQGEVRVMSRTDFPEERYAIGNILHAFNDKGESIPLTITSWRQHKQFDLLKFENYPNLTEVEKLKGLILKINRVNVENNLDDGEYFFHEIIGLTVYTVDGLELGVIKEILTPGANDVWVVKRKEKGKDFLIPYIDDVVKEIDLANQKVIIHPMEGLLDI